MPPRPHTRLSPLSQKQTCVCAKDSAQYVGSSCNKVRLLKCVPALADPALDCPPPKPVYVSLRRVTSAGGKVAFGPRANVVVACQLIHFCHCNVGDKD